MQGVLRRFGMMLLVLFGSGLTTAPALADPPPRRQWIAGWGASPSDPAPQLSGQTVREHVRGDHLHPNDAGYQAMAAAVRLHLFDDGH